MKCPKCGYNSFEYYDSCKKCSTDLVGFKQTHSITSVVLPSEAKTKLVTEVVLDEHVTEDASDRSESHDDIFSFDLPDSPSSDHSSSNDDPFNFDEPEPDLNKSATPVSDDDPFADLLESTSQSSLSPFSAPAVSVPSPATQSKSADNSSPGEFDLESFSWDDTPSAAADGTHEVVDDFDSLFGETEDKSSK